MGRSGSIFRILKRCFFGIFRISRFSIRISAGVSEFKILVPQFTRRPLNYHRSRDCGVFLNPLSWFMRCFVFSVRLFGADNVSRGTLYSMRRSVDCFGMDCPVFSRWWFEVLKVSEWDLVRLDMFEFYFCCEYHIEALRKVIRVGYFNHKLGMSVSRPWFYMDESTNENSCVIRARFYNRLIFLMKFYVINFGKWYFIKENEISIIHIYE